jgi:hypothetical protein
LRSGRTRILLNPISDYILMGFGPVGDVLGVRGIGADPSLREFVVIIGPLRNEVRTALILILLEPSLDIRSDELAGFGSA